MNFDEFRDSYREIKFDDKRFVPEDFKQRVENITDRIKRQDRRDKAIILGVCIFLCVICLIYLVLGINLYVEKPTSDLWLGNAIYVLAVLSAFPVLINKYFKIHRTKYDRPVLEFLKQVEKNYALFQPDILYTIPCLFLCGMSLVVIIYDGRHPSIGEILIVQIPLVVGVCVGWLIGFIMWLNKKLPILDEIRQIKESLEK